MSFTFAIKTSSFRVFNFSWLNSGAECAIGLEKVIKRTAVFWSLTKRLLTPSFGTKLVMRSRRVTETALGISVLEFLRKDNALVLR